MRFKEDVGKEGSRSYAGVESDIEKLGISEELDKDHFVHFRAQ